MSTMLTPDVRSGNKVIMRIICKIIRLLYFFQRVNETLLTNRRVYADLYARLMMADIEHEKQLHVYWKKRIEEWRKLNISSAITNFRYFNQYFI